MALEKIVVGRNKEDLKKYGSEGTVYIGKHIVGKGEQMHFTNPIQMDVTRPHVVLVTGKRGSGKSYSAGVIAEEMAKLPKDVKPKYCQDCSNTDIKWTNCPFAEEIYGNIVYGWWCDNCLISRNDEI